MRALLAKMSEEVSLHLTGTYKEKHEKNISYELIIYQHTYLPTYLTTVEIL
jgi:hypothetical protein